ncbi:MAG TPA: M20/M25/M40 family metallo-hydrolase [Thermoanaerobaculia bacterium]
MTANRTTAVVFVILAAILTVAIVFSYGHTPLLSNAPPDEFSAARAIVTLGAIYVGNAPHPIGSVAHDLARDRIVGEFRRLGYQTSLQQTFTCNAYGTCALVANVLAWLPGDARADTLMLSAHYDSVPAGPGASDDGIGVASLLEVARAIRHNHFRNTVLFLITDGEEDGLLGAEAFVADPQLSRDVAAVINVDNRGSAGRSYLFETSRHNRWLLPLIARGLPHPVASSFFFNLYELLPNDTDLTVFKRAGIAGINFACIGKVAHYHSPLDDIQHVTPSTVQDHGDHILAMTRALANTDLRQSTDEDAVFFDVMSTAMLWWPQSWTTWMAIAALMVLLFGAAIQIRNDETSARAITLGVASFFLSVIAAAIVGGVVAWVGSLRAPGAVWLAQPGPIVAAMWLIGIATAIVSANPLHARAGFDGLFIGHALCWIAVSIALAAVLPGGAYLALVPSIAFAICTILHAMLDLSPAASAIITSAVTAVLWFPIVITFYALIGRPSLSAIATVVALIATTFTPAAAASSPMRRASVAAMYATAAVCLAMQLLLPAFNPDSPRPIDVQYVDDGTKPAWVVDGVTPQLRAVAHFFLAPREMFPWAPSRVRAFSAPAPQLPFAPPELRVINDDRQRGRHLTLQVRSSRNAQRISLIFRAPDFTLVRVNGVRPPQQPPKFRSRFAPGWHWVSVRGAQQAQVEIVLRRNESIDAVLSDTSFELPPAAVPLTRARDASVAVPTGTGDAVIVRRRVRL